MTGGSPSKRNTSQSALKGRISDNPIEDIRTGRDWNLNHTVDGIQYIGNRPQSLQQSPHANDSKNEDIEEQSDMIHEEI